MKVLDLFSGIGGFSLGLERAGMTTAAFCEIEPYCQAVLKKHWPEVPIHDDIKKLNGSEYRGTVELVCGGYPCQPFSLAGKRNGQEDDRHLWPEMLRIIQQVRPSWVVCENVTGHITMGLDQVLSELELEGYSCQPFVIPACAVDAPHRRDRVWIIAHSDSVRVWNPKKSGAQCEAAAKSINDSANDTHANCQRSASGSEQTEREKRRESSGSCSRCSVANADSVRFQKWGPGRRGEGKERAAQTREAFAGENWWPTEPAVGRVVNGLPNRVDRVRALGNSVVPQVVEMIGRAIMEAHPNA